MRGGLRGWALGLAALLLAGCSGGGGNLAALGTPELLALLRSGQPVLPCREACLGEWRRVEPQARSFAAAGQWSELAALVMHTGYQDDLTLYYLGRAAEGLGFYPAAASYYRQSTTLSGTSISCANLSHLCGDVTLPAAARERLAMLERRRAAPKSRAAPAADAETPSPGAAQGPETQTPVRDYIEPPPAAK